MQSDIPETTRRLQFSNPLTPAAEMVHPVLKNYGHAQSSSLLNQRLSFEFSLEDHVKRTRKAASYLKQIYHSRDCHGQCQSPACKKVSIILSHVIQCSTPNCTIPGCNTTKSLLLHSQECCHSPFASASHRNNNNNCNNNTNNNYTIPTTTSLTTSSPTSSSICLLCTIALSGYATIKSFSTDDIVGNNNEEDVPLLYQPLIHDEIISYNRIPFQELIAGFSPTSSPDKTPPLTMNKTHQNNNNTNNMQMEVEDIEQPFVPRAKTFSDSDFILASSSSSSSSYTTASLLSSSSSTNNTETAAIILHDSQPAKKMRSKSLNVPYSGAPLFS